MLYNDLLTGLSAHALDFLKTASLTPDGERLFVESRADRASLLELSGSRALIAYELGDDENHGLFAIVRLTPRGERFIELLYTLENIDSKAREAKAKAIGEFNLSALD